MKSEKSGTTLTGVPEGIPSAIAMARIKRPDGVHNWLSSFIAGTSFSKGLESLPRQMVPGRYAGAQRSTQMSATQYSAMKATELPYAMGDAQRAICQSLFIDAQAEPSIGNRAVLTSLLDRSNGCMRTHTDQRAQEMRHSTPSE